MDSARATVVREDGDEFFIGYAPPMPPRLARYVSRLVIGLACGVLVWAVTVGAGHVPLEGGTFEFGHPQRFARHARQAPCWRCGPMPRKTARHPGCSWSHPVNMEPMRWSADYTDGMSRWPVLAFYVAPTR